MKWARGILALLVLAAGALWWVAGFDDGPALRFEDARARLVPGDGPMAGYLVVANHSGGLVRLVGARSEAFERVMIHRTEVVDGRARMQHQAGGVAISPGGRVEFRPGDLHLMLIGRKSELQIGDPVEVELEFEGLEPATWPVTFTVVPVTAQ